jgi:hypothetical protein
VGDKDWELAKALAMAGRQTGHRGLYLRRGQARMVRHDEAGDCCEALVASRNDGAAQWQALRTPMAGWFSGFAAAARREQGEEERKEEWASAAERAEGVGEGEHGCGGHSVPPGQSMPVMGRHTVGVSCGRSNAGRVSGSG